MIRRLPGWLRLIPLMIGWALIAKGLTVAIWVGIAVAVLLTALWLYRLRSTAGPDSDWIAVASFAATWAAWALAAWLVILFAAYIGFFVGVDFGWWEYHDE
jgi:hypothetical protein